MVSSAWNFLDVNASYQRCLDVHSGLSAVNSPDDLLKWSAAENSAWLDAVRSDPLLPAELLPKKYLGQRAWKSRRKTLARAHRLARRLPPPLNQSH